MNTASRAGEAHVAPFQGAPEARPGRSVRLIEQRPGRQLLDELRPQLEQLLEATSAPVTARLPWLLTWAEQHPEWTPLTFTVLESSGGAEVSRTTLVAAAMLAIRRRGPLADIVLLGHGPSDRAHLPAVDSDAAGCLAAGIVRGLTRIGRPWRVNLRQLPIDDATVSELARLLPNARLVRGLGSPRVVFSSDRRLAAYTSRNYRSQANHKWNQMERAGAEPHVLVTRAVAEIERHLPTVRCISQRRDREIAGRSPFDDPAYHRFFDELIMRHARCGEIEFAALEARGDIAAYSLAFLDRGVYRQWNKHMNPEWAAFRPGHVLDARLLARTLADPELLELDWMAGDEPYKLRTATDVVGAQGLRGWSPAVTALLDAGPVLKDLSRPLVERHANLERLRDRAREFRNRVRRWRG